MHQRSSEMSDTSFKHRNCILTAINFYNKTYFQVKNNIWWQITVAGLTVNISIRIWLEYECYAVILLINIFCLQVFCYINIKDYGKYGQF